MEYLAKISKLDGHFLVSFPDFPNINTYGDNFEDAMENAAEALNGCLESDFERGFELPKKAKRLSGKLWPIKIWPHIEIAYNLRQLRKDDSQVSIARKLGISYQAYQKLENPRKCNPTIKTLEKIGQALGREVEIKIR